jgi:hydrogenase nickel incorporation protein HypB
MAFHTADLVLVTKMDLASAVGFDESALRANLARVAPASTVLPVSVRTGIGLDDWLTWLQSPPS